MVQHKVKHKVIANWMKTFDQYALIEASQALPTDFDRLEESGRQN